MKTVWRVFSYLKRYPWIAAGTLTCAILGRCLSITAHCLTPKRTCRSSSKRDHSDGIVVLQVLKKATKKIAKSTERLDATLIVRGGFVVLWEFGQWMRQNIGEKQNTT